MKNFKTPLLLATLAIAATAAAEPKDQHRLEPPQPLLEIQKRDSRADAPQKTMEILVNGAWWFHEEIGGKLVATATGQLADADLKAITDELDAAKWTIVKHAVHCMARSTASTAFSVRDKQVFVGEACGDPLDDASAKALADAQTRLAAAWKQLAAAWP